MILSDERTLCHPLIGNKHCDDFYLIGTFLRFKAAFGLPYFVGLGLMAYQKILLAKVRHFLVSVLAYNY